MSLLNKKLDSTLVEGGGFEPPKLARQIYSLIPLATQEPLPKEALDSAFESMQCQTKFNNKEPSLAKKRLRKLLERIGFPFLPSLALPCCFLSSKACSLWCRHQESNSGPTDYKSVALPAEL